MKMKSVLVLVLTAVQWATGVIYHLSDAEYARMPNLFQLDDYHGCLREPGDLYCNVDADLVANDTNELYTLLREYSDNAVTHYDHTEIHWGICVTKMCGAFIEGSNLRQGLEACLNATLYEKYQMGAKLIHKTTVCTGFGESPEFDLADSLLAVVVVAILLLNGLGTFYDVCNKGSKSFVSKILLCFSAKRSWQRFIMPSGEGPDRRLRQLTSLNGFKVISTLLVIVAHSALTGLTFIDNPQNQENTYQNPFYQFMYNGTFIVQTFFIISGFLLAYNMLVSTEKRPADCGFLPKAVFLRWLRLVPTYALVLAFICTWMRHLGSGPLWKPVVDIEIQDCRRDWWLHLLFIDNYIDSSQCMAQTWYLSSDMQLSVLGLLIFCALQSSRARKAAIAVTLVIGLLTPAVHTYVQDLYPILVVAPESARRYFVEDPTFNSLYKRGHTNLVCYAMGMALGMLIYKLHNNDLDVKKYRKYRLLYWGAFPVALAIVFSGMIFYVDGFEVPLAIRVVYSSVVRLIFGLCITFLIAGTILKMENIYRPILEWNGWAPLSRLSYCAYLLHVTVVRTSVIHYSTLQHNGFYKMAINFFGVAGVSYMLAVVCWGLVEAPLQSLIKLCFSPQREQKTGPEVCVVRKEVET